MCPKNRLTYVDIEESLRGLPNSSKNLTKLLVLFHYRILIIRYHFNHSKSSIQLFTLPNLHTIEANKYIF